MSWVFFFALDLLLSFFLSSRFFLLLLFSGFFFGFFLLFLGLYIFCSLFEIECKKLKIHVFLNSTVKTRDPYGINVSNSTSRKRVFKPQDLYRTRVSKTDASLQ